MSPLRTSTGEQLGNKAAHHGLPCSVCPQAAHLTPALLTLPESLSGCHLCSLSGPRLPEPGEPSLSCTGFWSSHSGSRKPLLKGTGGQGQKVQLSSRELQPLSPATLRVSAPKRPPPHYLSSHFTTQFHCQREGTPNIPVATRRRAPQMSY